MILSLYPGISDGSGAQCALTADPNCIPLQYLIMSFAFPNSIVCTISERWLLNFGDTL